MFGKIIRKFLPPPFSELENKLINELMSHLPDEHERLLHQQVSKITFSQKTNDCREINYYITRKRGGEQLSDEYKFKDFIVGEHRIAKANISINRTFSSELVYWLVDGRFFSLDFSNSPKEYLNVENVENVEIIDFEIYLNQNINEPKNKNYILPCDYFALLKKREFQKTHIFEESAFRRVAIGSEMFYIIAEHSNEYFLMLKDGNNDSNVYFMYHDDESPEKLDRSLMQAIDYITTNGST